MLRMRMKITKIKINNNISMFKKIMRKIITTKKIYKYKNCLVCLRLVLTIINS